MIGAELGYKVELCLPADAGVGRKKALEAYGAKIIEIDPLEGPDGVYIAAISMLLKDPEKYFYPDQNNNDANWEAHYTGTAEEILKQTGGKVTHFLAGAGTSGTFTGVAKKLREHGAKSILMQPDSPFHGLEGVKHLESTIRPHFFDYGLADEIVTVSTEAAYAMTRRLAREAGMFVGVSSGANVRAALETAKKLPPGSLLVTVLCDDGNHYLTKPVWDEVWHISGERFNESVKKNRWSI
jgi:cysteine synthase B